ncbi:MAG: UDP-2,3-diacylglucosamine diphosphatase [Bacteroidetes bacterium]|nr:UDP-2,3-diacylglucosamine diphosphatase [Bacteroidota bacterium]MBU1718656.1 UDP-2,3-diacylglucosamine diphosphatase [Bacteroidota bacterium]
MKNSREREKRIVDWLTSIENDAQAVFLLGDVFDFWHEYKAVVPKGFTRLFGKLNLLVDKGIEIFFFTGNHDMWIRSFFEEECGWKIFRKPIFMEINRKKLHVGHGDGLGPGDARYKFLKFCFSSKLLQWCFARLHPNFALGMAKYWSGKSRQKHIRNNYTFEGEQEWLVIYCRNVLENQHVDYFIFGHRHIPVDYSLDTISRYLNPGDWFESGQYIEFDGAEMNLRYLG